VADPAGRTHKLEGKQPFDRIVQRMRQWQDESFPQVTKLKGTDGRWTISGRQAAYKDWYRAEPKGGVHGRDVFIDDPQGLIFLTFIAPEAEFDRLMPVLLQILNSLQFPK